MDIPDPTVLRVGTPEEAGIHPSAVKQMVRRGQEWVDKGIHSALVLLAARRGVIYLHQAFGQRSEEDPSGSLPLDAIFPVSSISKVFTSTLAMMLVEDGLIGLTRPVQEYIPEFQGKNKEKVLVHHLMTHTAGIEDEAVDHAIEESEKGALEPEVPAPEPTSHPTVHRWLHLGLPVPLIVEPGTLMLYSNFGIQMLGEIIRRVSGKSLDELAREKIFDPLGMRDTFYSLPKDLIPRVVHRPESAPEAETLNSVEFFSRPSPSGGVLTTAIDLAVFGQMFLNQGMYGDQRILSPVSVSAMTRNQISGISARFLDMEFPEGAWGLGWSINAPFKGEAHGEPMLSWRAFAHGGSGGAFFWMDPRDEIVGVSLSVVLKEREENPAGLPLWSADLIMNMTAASVVNG
jgi:CubicO group peptidase (beta-lactamase class C family)